MRIAKRKDDISVYNKDVRSFMKNYLHRYSNVFLYLDPPYYKKGQELYKNFFVDKDHKEIADLLPRSVLNKPCILLPYVGSNLGEVGIFPCEYICHLASNIAKVELVSDKYLLDYIKYYLQSDIGQGYLFQNKQGSAQPNITMDSIRNTCLLYTSSVTISFGKNSLILD